MPLLLLFLIVYDDEDMDIEGRMVVWVGLALVGLTTWLIQFVARDFRRVLRRRRIPVALPTAKVVTASIGAGLLTTGRSASTAWVARSLLAYALQSVRRKISLPSFGGGALCGMVVADADRCSHQALPEATDGVEAVLVCRSLVFRPIVHGADEALVVCRMFLFRKCIERSHRGVRRASARQGPDS